MGIAADKHMQTAALELVQNEHIMTLAVAGNGHPWAAPVYYIYSGHSFWFFSSPASAHIQGAQPDGRAAAAIYAPSAGWQDIRGLQMTGVLEAARASTITLAALARYVKRFAFIDELLRTQTLPPGFNSGASLDLKTLEEAFRVKWYRFIPELACYVDNRTAFGHRERVELP